MNIVFITKETISEDEAPPSRIFNLKRILQKYHNVSIIAKDSRIKDDDITCIGLNYDNFFLNQIYKFYMVILSLGLILSRKIDFFVTREYYYVVLLYPFTRIFGCKIIYDMHCFRYKELKVESRNFKSFLVRPFEAMAHKLADNISVISNGILHEMPDNIKKKSFLLPNGVNINDFNADKADDGILKKYNIPTNVHLVGFIGNWMEWVDIDTLLQSSNYYEKNVKLLVIGKCYKDIDLIKLKKVYPNAFFTGRIPHSDAINLLYFVEVCVLPYKKVQIIKHLSIRKTSEYLAAGKPIIISNSDIGEKEFLVENKNALYYEPENPRDLCKKISKIISDRNLRKKLSKNNLILSHSFSWERIVHNSRLFEIIKTHDLYKSNKVAHKKIAIIIKALNEEKYIKQCIMSAMRALKGLHGEIILIDSKSSDNTVAIAKKFPIRIIQLKNEKDRCCGVGPQLGYMYSNADFLYILDGDMILDSNFIKNALPYFSDSQIAGVGGNITEKSTDNLAFQARTKNHMVSRTANVNQLGMGGIYRRGALDKIGYFSNPYFYAYEEYELGANLLRNNFELLRISQPMVTHYGDTTSHFDTLISRWKSKYIFGSGQYLRHSISSGNFVRAILDLKIYIVTLLWAFMLFSGIFVLFWTDVLFKFFLYSTLVILLFLVLIKKSFKGTVFSIISWNFQAAGLLIGFIKGAKKPSDFQPSLVIIKNG